MRPVVSRVPRAGTQPPERSASRGRHGNHHWRGDWRSDRRYDWRRHRNRYSFLFNLGFYRDPFGWGYQPFSVGWRMWPSYYSQQLLAQRSVAVSPALRAAGLSLDSLL